MNTVGNARIVPLAVAAFKAFGDFVIAHASLRTVPSERRSHVRILAGSHLKELAAALPSDVTVSFLHAGGGPPALFDLRKRGILRGMRSARELHAGLRSLERSPTEVLVFPRLGMRERLIAGGWPAKGIYGDHPNIYQAYAHLLELHALLEPRPEPSLNAVTGPRVGIFPTSRQPRKNLPAQAIQQIAAIAERAGLEPRVFHMDGELRVAPPDLDTVQIPRSFRALLAALKSVDTVISADSLPAHLAEYVGRPVFVVSPAPNSYWLPLSCFHFGYWGLLGDTKLLGASVGRFFQELSTGR